MDTDALIYRRPWTYPTHAHRWHHEPWGEEYEFGNPIGLVSVGTMDPAVAWEDESRPRPDLVRLALAEGRRPCFAFIPPREPAPTRNYGFDPDEEPRRHEIIEYAIELGAGDNKDRARAREMLRKLTQGDRRAMDAHVGLGRVEAFKSHGRARHAFTDAVACGETTVRAGFSGMLPWARTENRPFLEGLQGLAWCSWRENYFSEARRILDSLVWLDPSDRLNACAWIDLIDAGIEHKTDGFPALPVESQKSYV